MLPHFVHFLQNHDQVANSARGLRTHSLTTAGRHRALTTLLLLGPQTPMLFMGQEFSASNPFYYFADHDPELAKLVSAGRRAFMSQFPRLGSFENEFELADPAEESTFLECKLDWDEVKRTLARRAASSRPDPIAEGRCRVLAQDRSAVEGSVIGPEAFLLRWFGEDYDDRLAIFNLGRDIDWQPVAEPLLAPPPERQWGRCGRAKSLTMADWERRVSMARPGGYRVMPRSCFARISIERTRQLARCGTDRTH